MRFSRLVRVGLLVAALSSHPCAFAQSLPIGFSRACQFTALSSVNQGIYASIFGLTVFGYPYSQLSSETLSQLWAVESITADYGQFRYWLHAQSGQYRNGNWELRYATPWNSVSLYDNNRGLMTSVRAGHDLNSPQGITGWGLFEYKGSGAFESIGYHYYWDGYPGRAQLITVSRATDCNCWEWGFAYSAPALFAGLFACTYQ